jgi:flagellar protein FlaG
MSVVQSSSELGLTGLATELKRSAEPLKTNDVAKGIEQDVGVNKQSIDNISAIQQAGEISESHNPLNVEQLEKVAQQLQDFVGDLNRNLEFSVDKDSGRDVIKVFDKDSGDLLKQFPSEEVLTLVSKLSEMVGGFVDAKV